MNQDRRDAHAWAQDWAVRRRNKRIIFVIVGIIAAIVIAFAVRYISIVSTRTIYGSEEEMRAALQGRFAYDKYEDIEISGDDVTLTYYELSHYDEDYAREYGYREYGDSVYDDYVEKWDYRHGVIKMHWMSDIIVDKQGNIQYYSQTFRKTDDPKPTPIDPSILEDEAEADAEATDADGAADAISEVDEEELEKLLQENNMTREQAEAAGLLDGATTDETEDSTDGNN